ncbi:hypothetical protein NQZ68_022513 [Dissostichus eleginoides]|nr:hypothetical protein NQZ68_022513 [Dissostichus eleginoides]
MSTRSQERDRGEVLQKIGLEELLTPTQVSKKWDNLKGKYKRSVLGVIGDVEKMVAIPAVVQSFHQAPPVDLQVRGDPRAPEWANDRAWCLIRSRFVPTRGSGFEPFITETVGDWVRSQKDDLSLSALWTELLPAEKLSPGLGRQMKRAELADALSRAPVG